MSLLRNVCTVAALFAATCLAQRPKPPSCDDSAFRQFDYWLGDWEVKSGTTTVGYSRIEKLLDGCLVLENWYGMDGNAGKSLNFYQRASKTWRQVYVGIGWNIDYDGQLQDDQMVLRTNRKLSSGEMADVRLTFSPLDSGRVRQHKEQSIDGIQWRTVYDYDYVRRSSVENQIASLRSRSLRCNTPPSRQFDFWAGEWDVYVPQGRAGSNWIEPIVGGCVLFENWAGAAGGNGKSFNFYDAEKGEWRQVWVSAASVLDLHGKWENGSLSMSGENRPPGSISPVRQRITWTPHADGSVRQHWEQSRDGGKTWTTAFDGRYVHRVYA